jgi:chemotaxis protein MotB
VEIVIKQNERPRPPMRESVDDLPSDGVIEFDLFSIEEIEELAPDEIF